jgi:hypothetical protein
MACHRLEKCANIVHSRNRVKRNMTTLLARALFSPSTYRIGGPATFDSSLEVNQKKVNHDRKRDHGKLTHACGSSLNTSPGITGAGSIAPSGESLGNIWSLSLPRK